MSVNSPSSTAFSKASAPTAEMSISPAITPTPSGSDESEPRTDDKDFRHNIFGKVAGLLLKSISRSRENSVSSVSSVVSEASSPRLASPRINSPSVSQRTRLAVKETKHVSLEYDPITRRKVLNTYEIFREIGRGEHGKVKLARDLVHDELVAIKIVNRKSKKDRQLRMRRPSMPANSDYETKIKREIAIMKRCNHKYIVKLKEVLDDLNLYKIYLVLEYMDKGEIKWKRLKPIENPRPQSAADDEKIPCCDANQNAQHADNDLLSNHYSPNLTFKQSRRIFRDVLLGLEYLHLQGIVHRDIKPANLLVSSDNVVKISDFGVSFASSLSSSDEGEQVSDMELAKTVGTPAFFAPELCQTNFSASSSTINVGSTEMQKSASQSSTGLPKIDHKIDIWAFGVTMYCLLFGKVPFNADSEFILFDVIVNQPLEFPKDRFSFHSPQDVSEEEFELAKDLLSKMLDKNSRSRIDIEEIKQHPFVLLDLDNDMERLHELFFLNAEDPLGTGLKDSFLNVKDLVLQEEVENAVVGVGARIRSSIVRAIKSKDSETLRRFALRMEHSTSTSSSEDSNLGSHQNSYAYLGNPLGEHSVILSEAFQTSSGADSRVNLQSHDYYTGRSSHGPSHLSQLNSGSRQSVVYGRNNLLFLDSLDPSPAESRKGSSGAIQEAPQIETKRNVGGDLYLKNQSAIDTFKGIQEMDQKRRRSSIFATSNRSSSSAASTLPTKSSYDEGTICQPLSVPSAPIAIDSSSKIKVGPISIENGRRPSSVISLPLTASFASLDSFNDDYLSYKYQEFRKKKHALRFTDPGAANSDSALLVENNYPDHTISEKFKNFNLGSQMTGDVELMKPKFGIQEGIAPTANIAEKQQRLDCDSLSSSLSSSSSGSGSDSDEEGGNLTLKFSSKVAPKSRPPFLTFGHRAMSHESNLRNLVHQQEATNFYDVPIVFQNHLLEFEDVPADLMGSVAAASDMTPTSSVLTSNVSSATITQDIQKLRAASQQIPIQSSPLCKEVVGSPIEQKTKSALEHELGCSPVEFRLNRNSSESKRSFILNGYFNNHYKKEPVNSPFPKAKHLDTDKDSVAKQMLKKSGSEARPNYYRSNSITVGLLQHQRSNTDISH